MNKTLRNIALVMVIVVLAAATWAIVLSMSDARRAKRQAAALQSEVAETVEALPFGNTPMVTREDELAATTPADREYRERLEDAVAKARASDAVYRGYCEKCDRPRWIDQSQGMWVCTICSTANFDPPERVPEDGE